MTAMIQGDQIRSIALGIKVDKATGTVVTGTTTLFTIAGGRILLTSLVGRVTTAIGATVTTAKITYNPTAAGTSYDMCTAVAITSDAVEQTYTLALAGVAGTPGALVVAGDVGLAQPIVTNPYLIQAGTLEQIFSADPVGGAITWSLTYVPYDNGASVVAA